MHSLLRPLIIILTLFKRVLNKQETEIDYRILQYTFAGEFNVIDIIDSDALKNIKACLQSKDKQVILKFANKEDKSKEGSKIDRENDSDKENNSRKRSKIDGENNSENKND